MKKALSLLAVFLVAVMWSASGFSADKYVSGNIGIVWLQDVTFDPAYEYVIPYPSVDADFDSGITLLGAFGCDYGSYRVEGELGYQSGDLNNITIDGVALPVSMEGDLKVLSLLANGYYDIDLGGVELYGTAGVGVARVSFDDISYGLLGSPDYTEHATTFAYQVGAGLALPVADDVMIDARYRYFSTTEFTLDDVGIFDAENATVSSHSALLGLRINL